MTKTKRDLGASHSFDLLPEEVSALKMVLFARVWSKLLDGPHVRQHVLPSLHILFEVHVLDLGLEVLCEVLSLLTERSIRLLRYA